MPCCIYVYVRFRGKYIVMDARSSQCVSVGMKGRRGIASNILLLYILFVPWQLDEENNDQKHRKPRPTLLYIICKEETYLDGCSSPCVSVGTKGRPNCGEDLHQIIGLLHLRSWLGFWYFVSFLLLGFCILHLFLFLEA